MFYTVLKLCKCAELRKVSQYFNLPKTEQLEFDKHFFATKNPFMYVYILRLNCEGQFAKSCYTNFKKNSEYLKKIFGNS